MDYILKTTEAADAVPAVDVEAKSMRPVVVELPVQVFPDVLISKTLPEVTLLELKYPKVPVVSDASVTDTDDAVVVPVAVLPSNRTLPAAVHNAYLLVMVVLLPAAGALAMYTVAALVMVPELGLAMVG